MYKLSIVLNIDTLMKVGIKTLSKSTSFYIEYFLKMISI